MGAAVLPWRPSELVCCSEIIIATDCCQKWYGYSALPYFFEKVDKINLIELVLSLFELSYSQIEFYITTDGHVIDCGHLVYKPLGVLYKAKKL